MQVSKNRVSRRVFLEYGTGLTGALVLGFHLPLLAASVEKKSFQPNAWLKFLPTGEIIFILDKVEMGQGVMTTLATIIAEELDIHPARLRIEQAPAEREYKNKISGIQITGGSTSVASSFDSLRHAGASARQVFILAAARKWSVAPETCTSKDGLVYAPNQNMQPFTFADLCEEAAKISPPASVLLKKKSEWRFLGQSLTRLDTFAKVTGRAGFGIDVQLKDLLHAVVIRKPTLHAALKDFTLPKGTTPVGWVDVFAITAGVAVVAKTYWQARRASELVTVNWSEETTKNAALNSAAMWQELAKQAGEKDAASFLHKGDVDTILAATKQQIRAEYKAPYLAHATMEPCNYTAHVQPGRVDLYGPSQSPGMAKQIACEITGYDPDDIHVHSTFLGGGFGRRLAQDYVAEACEISQRLMKPVKVLWNREEDIRHDYFRPASFHILRGALNAEKKITAWSHRISAPSILAQQAPPFVRTLVPEWLPEFAKRAAGWSAQRGVRWFNRDETCVEGAKDIPYAIENLRVDFKLCDPGVPVGFWRSVGHSYTAFVVESFMDEMAVLAAEDPLQFRLRHLPEKSPARQVLEAVAKLAQWHAPLMKHEGMGIAQHSSFGSHCAQIVKVRMQADLPILEKVFCVIACGTSLNPDLIKAQVESAVVFAASAALYGEISLKDGRVEQSNFDNYPVLRMDKMPHVQVAILPSDAPPGGVGEPGVPPFAPALCNAIFACSGRRIRNLPIKAGFSPT